jgi:hypothetical protein
MDKSPTQLTESEAFYLLNHERFVNIPTGGKGDSIGTTTPLPANYEACDITQPAGEVYCIGAYRSPLTNEVYSWHYNSNGVHYVLRINSLGCEIVYHGCLSISPDPKHSIEQWRAYLKVEKVCSNRHGKYLIWTDGSNPIGWIDVEASIATNFFTTDFFTKCQDDCSLVQMCVPKPCGCLEGEFVPLPDAEAGLTNHLVDVGLKFMFRHVYYDGRASEWSDTSTLFFQDTKGCFDTSSGFSRCLRLRVPVGNPMVDKIELAYSKDGGGSWLLADTIDKYKKYNSAQQYWYERQLAELKNYSDSDCSFDYYFCNDKQCEPIDVAETNRVYNPMPREAQGIIPIKDSLGFYNFKQGNCILDKSEVEKVKVKAVCNTADCQPRYATVKVRAIIHNHYHNRNQFIYQLEGGAVREDTKKWFGGLNNHLSGGFETGYDQYFNDDIQNFIAYIEGTDYWTEMKQWKSDAFFTNRTEWGTVTDMDDGSTQRRWRRDSRHGGFFYQEAEFKVPRGTRGFIRLSSHHATGNSQDTSTFVASILDNIGAYKGDGISSYDTKEEEIYFDTCNGDVDLVQAFIITDNAVDAGLANKATGFFGKITDKNNSPVEGAIVSMGGTFSYTDHNGFYHLYIPYGTDDELTAYVKAEYGCDGGWVTVFQQQAQGAIGENTELNMVIDSVMYADEFYANVKVQVKDCDGSPVGGLRVALSGSKYRITSDDGYATFKIRNYPNRQRHVRAVLMDFKNCFDVDCNGNCNPCINTPYANTVPCYKTNPTITLPPIVINKETSLSNNRGLKAGGNYPFAFVLEGCGRITAANEVGNISIPKTQEKGKISFCQFSLDATGFIAPEWAECLKIVRGVNLNPFELQWLVDKVERVDGKIRLTIQSLNDYNASYNFRTNTVYQFLKGDRVEFISNGDGKVFETSVHGLLNYQTLSPFLDKTIVDDEDDLPADYFNQLLIEDDGRLDDLKEGAKIELQRLKECTTLPTYHEICVSIPIINRRLAIEKLMFSTFDTYFIRRKVGKFSITTFEHHSPSDFWGDRLTDAGKAHVANKYENERRFGRSLSISAATQPNWFGDIVKTFDAPEHGDIISMNITDGKVILAIGEYDSFLAQSSDDLLRVGGDGLIRAAAADSIISDTEPKLSGKFGCQYSHIGSVLYGDGFATWWDVTKASWVVHDYSEAKDVSFGKCKSWVSKRCQEIQSHNSKQTNFLDHYRFSTGLNNANGTQYLTIKTIRESGINNERKPYQKKNETMAYHPIANEFFGFVSFTPEMYSQLELADDNGCSFLTFLKGKPYIHPIIADSFNEFYGVAVDRVVGIAISKFPEKNKVALSIEVQSTAMWYVTEVTTGKENFRSEIPPIRWKGSERKWNAAFLCNANGRGGLYGNQNNHAGEPPRGKAISVTFVRDNTDALKYNTTDNAKRVKYDETDLFLFKFVLSEQSAFTENL